MKFKNSLLGAVALAGCILGTGMTRQAEAALIGTFQGNDCAGVLGPNFASCNYNGSPIIIKFDVDTGTTEINTAAFPTISGTEFSFNPGFTSSGTWTYTPGPGDPVITAYAAKGGPAYNLFTNDGAPNSGEWFTPTNPNNGRPYGLSHLSFYDTVAGTPVPEPASMLLFGTALLGLGAAARRRAARTTNRA